MNKTTGWLLTSMTLLLILSFAIAGSPYKDIAQLLDLATFGITTPLADEFSTLGSSNETNGLNEFFFRDNSSRGSGGDLGLTVAPCLEVEIWTPSTCILDEDCAGTCATTCAAYDQVIYSYCPISNLCDCWCQNTGGCFTCGSNAVEFCSLLSDSTTCQGSYTTGDQSCLWVVPDGTPSFCTSGYACTPCFLAGTKIITVDNF